MTPPGTSGAPPAAVVTGGASDLRRPTLVAAAGAGHSPFTRSRPALLLAAAYALLAVVTVVAQPWTVGWLRGGRWLPVHLFTLGVLTNLVLAMSRHFGSTLTRARGAVEAPPLWLANGGAVAVIVGVVGDIAVLVAVGAMLVSAAVWLNYRTLRAMRKHAVGSRFAFVVRAYERAHAAFFHGAILGALLGTGALGDQWYVAARAAHVHVNVLGWAGLTLLGTLVFFGPTMLRARLEPDADVMAATALRWGATALTVAVLALLASGAPDYSAGEAARVVAALGLGAYAAAAVAICSSVIRASRRAGARDLRVHVVGACLWFAAGVAADAVVILLGRHDLLDAVGVAILVGGLAQAVLAAFAYIAAASSATRAAQRVPYLLPVVLNVALVVAIAGIASGGHLGAVVTRGAAATVAVAVAYEIAAAAHRLVTSRDAGRLRLRRTP